MRKEKARSKLYARFKKGAEVRVCGKWRLHDGICGWVKRIIIGIKSW